MVENKMDEENTQQDKLAQKARTTYISELSKELERLLPEVLSQTRFTNVHSLNATYGGKHANYIDIKNAVINSPAHFISLYCQGFLKYVEEHPRKFTFS